MKITRLKVEFDYEFQLLALISSARDYKLAWHLNKTLNLHLCKAEDLYFEFLDKSKIYISNFIFEKEYSSFRLLKNKACEFYDSTKPYLLPELKEYDYFIYIKDEGGEWDGSVVSDMVRNIPIVEYIKKVEIDNLKSKENLIFN